MKIIFSLLLGTAALANAFTGEGLYLLPHDVAMLGYGDEAECETDGGKWNGEFCFFEGQDEVAVEKEGEGYRIRVSTIATNAHSCEFEGAAQWESGALIARAPSEVWNDYKIVPAICELTLTFVDGITVNVTNNGNCASFCGMRAGLTIYGAKRAE